MFGKRFNFSVDASRPASEARAWKCCAAAAGLVCCLVPLRGALAQVAPPGPRATQSYSGQFIVRAMPAPRLPGRLANLETNRNFIQLEPTLLAISGERIKQILWRNLEANAPWQGKIFLGLYPARSANDPITIACQRFRDRWQYQVGLPNLLERARYVRAMTQVLLLEMANRTAGERSAEIPLWLIEGLSEQLLASSEIEIILPPPRTSANGIELASTNISGRRKNPLAEAHKRLCAGPMVTFQQLSWPASDQLDGPGGDLYRSSAQLFVNQLLSLNDGPACLQAMLAELPRHYNWQFAFLHAFRGHFSRPLEVEKWWALQMVHFTGRDLAQTWPVAESWRKLDEVVRSAVQVRTGTNDLPLRAEVSLQTVIREWDRPHQVAALRGKLRELESLRLRLARELVPLADEYRRTLATYLEKLDQTNIIPFRKRALQRQAVAEVLKQLDALDAERTGLRPESETKAAGPKTGVTAQVR